MFIEVSVLSTHSVFNLKRKIELNYLKSAAMRFFLGTHAQVQNSHGKQAISIQAIEVLLYLTVISSFIFDFLRRITGVSKSHSVFFVVMSLKKYRILTSLLTSQVSCLSPWARQHFPALLKIEQTLSHR